MSKLVVERQPDRHPPEEFELPLFDARLPTLPCLTVILDRQSAPALPAAESTELDSDCACE